MPGRPDFSKAVANIRGRSVAVQNRPEVGQSGSDTSTSLASGSGETTEFYAPTSSVYSVIGVYAYMKNNSDATSGTISVSLASQGIGVMHGESGYGNKVYFRKGRWEADTPMPTNEAAQQLALEKLRATENNPITVTFWNGTDAPHDERRKVQFAFEESEF